MTTVSYDERALCIDGERQLLLSGAIHYPRTTPAMWPDLMRRSREAGLNCIETYVFWNLHERRQGVYDFSDRLDLVAFIEAAQEAGLKVILRIGPYICAETNYGGFPAWLRDVPGVRFRTWNQPFMDAVWNWVRVVTDMVRPHLASNGGPIIMTQFENEYDSVDGMHGGDAQRYLEWSAGLNARLETGIPVCICGGGSAPDAITTINSPYPHQRLGWMAKHHPDQPAICTECYPGWYSCFGYGLRSRTAEDMAYATARFIAAGGTGQNYYMWHAGTNFAREGMYLQPPAYGFSAPLDEYGRATAMSAHLAGLHRVLQRHARCLLGADRPTPECLAADVCRFTYGSGTAAVQFLCNDGDEVARIGRTRLAPKSVRITSNGRLLYDSARQQPEAKRRPSRRKPPVLSAVSVRREPLPAAWPELCRQAMRSKEIVEQLGFTRDETDYCWYTTTLTVSAAHAGKGTLRFEGVADLVSIFVNGRRLARTEGPLPENRILHPDEVDAKALGVYAEYGQDFSQTFELTLSAGQHRLEILCSALGLAKIEFMLGGANLADERKGLWGGVSWSGQPLVDWAIRPGLLHENQDAISDEGRRRPWRPATARRQRGPFWCRARFDCPSVHREGLTVDLAAMDKGMLFLNGRMVSRYWTVPAAACDPILKSWHMPFVEHSCDEPTQRFYRLPAEWLRDENELLLFEEFDGRPADLRLAWR